MLVEYIQLLKQSDHLCQYWCSDGGLELDISIIVDKNSVISSINNVRNERILTL